MIIILLLWYMSVFILNFYRVRTSNGSEGTTEVRVRVHVMWLFSLILSLINPEHELLCCPTTSKYIVGKYLAYRGSFRPLPCKGIVILSTLLF